MNSDFGMMSASEVPLLLQKASGYLQNGDESQADALLQCLSQAHPNNYNVLNSLALLRYKQNKLPEATVLLIRSIQAWSEQPNVHLILGGIFSEQGKRVEAEAAIRAAIELEPSLTEAHFALANVLYQTGRFDEAERSYRRVLELSPRHVLAKLRLSAVLIDTKRAAESELMSRQALREINNHNLVASFEENLGISLSMQSRLEEALDCYERAQEADSTFTHLDHRRACILQTLGRFNEAIKLYRQVLLREPMNLAAHEDYNNLLYSLGHDEEFLRSYDEAAIYAADKIRLRAAQAEFLLKAQRPQDALAIYRSILACDGGRLETKLGVSVAFSQMKQFDNAFEIMEAILRQYPNDPDLYSRAAALLVQMRDPKKALEMVHRGLMIRPYDQTCLALLGTSYRMLCDEREHWLNDYAKLVRIFDLEPPHDYSSMAMFNRELGAYLGRLHPPGREFISQSLRGGTQTRNKIFGAGHGPVEKLRTRIDEAVARYIGELGSDKKHPLVGRKSKTFSYDGSWSSRLRNRGYHVNHVHAGGWISSCYYVEVPDVVADCRSKEGWIKFGEPPYDVGLAEPVARSIQPVSGRLVLFPSYTWHGTFPFYSSQFRTTIAFDVLPD